VEANLKEDEYEIWKRQSALAEDDKMALNPLLYWQSVAGQFPVLSKFAIDILTIPAAATDCERTFSELGNMFRHAETADEAGVNCGSAELEELEET
jgi:hypothetical protein